MRNFFIFSAVALSLVAGDAKINCAACQIVVGLFERLAMKHKCSVKNATQYFCEDLAPKFDGGQKLCEEVTSLIAPLIEVDYLRKLSPQHTCINQLKLCSANPTCNLYTQWPPPPPPVPWPVPNAPASTPLSSPPSADASTNRIPQTSSSSSSSSSSSFRTLAKTHGKSNDFGEKMESFFAFFALGIGLRSSRSFDLLSVNGGPIDNIINHLPIDDMDNDRFSPLNTLRGADWRGKDCDDRKGDVYPGRRDTTHPASVDHNCNGIYGTDVDGVSFEDKWCKDSGNLGVIAIGDSATAHFRVPPDWLDAYAMDNTTYQHVLPLAENELDWPMCSSSTAHRNASYCPKAILDITSIYLKLRERNQCNHRDYQNLGVNGARTTSGGPPDGTAMAMKFRNGTDYPSLVVYAMIGNDVCSGHPDFTHMTPPEVFESKVLDTLTWLDAHLQSGSHVVFSGLVDGRVLYDTMHSLQHPVGTTYEDVYSFLNCLENNPCWGWLNTNETVRNMTSAHAYLLNQVYPKIIREHATSFKNFDMFYVDTYSILNDVWKKWVEDGHQARDLIEPTDGFHPSQTGNTLLAENLWLNITVNFPASIGLVNPHNDEITARFGDQGGY